MSKLFTKKEFIYLFVILLVIFSATIFNYQAALLRSRDARRKQDVRDIYDALEVYHTESGVYPSSEDGKIVICDTGSKDEDGGPVFRKCEWGENTYIVRLSVDPNSDRGTSYLYLSDTKYFQLYAALEGSAEPEYDRNIISRNLSCGNMICNFGLGSPKTPLDKSLEEYQNEINAKNSAK